MELSILTPEKLVFEGEADSLKLPGSLGLMGVLNRHAPILTGLVPGALTFKSKDSIRKYFISDGFFEFNSNKATILTNAAEEPGNIDVERAGEAARRAKERLRIRKNIDIDRAQRALFRALTRQKISIASR